jgi:hypothetical protein
MNTITMPGIFSRYTQEKYDRFQKWLNTKHGQTVCALFRQFSEIYRNAGHDRCGANLVGNRIQWEMSIGEYVGYKVSNDFLPMLARQMVICAIINRLAGRETGPREKRPFPLPGLSTGSLARAATKCRAVAKRGHRMLLSILTAFKEEQQFRDDGHSGSSCASGKAHTLRGAASRRDDAVPAGPRTPRDLPGPSRV